MTTTTPFTTTTTTHYDRDSGRITITVGFLRYGGRGVEHLTFDVTPYAGELARDLLTANIDRLADDMLEELAVE